MDICLFVLYCISVGLSLVKPHYFFQLTSYAQLRGILYVKIEKNAFFFLINNFIPPILF